MLKHIPGGDAASLAIEVGNDFKKGENMQAILKKKSVSNHFIQIIIYLSE